MEYFCTTLLPLYVGNSSLAFETVLFMDKNLEQLCNETPFLSKYFPSFMKVRLNVASTNITLYPKEKKIYKREIYKTYKFQSSTTLAFCHYMRTPLYL